MDKVLMIANQFPPMGGSGVQRTLKFVKHLRNFRYEPIVFTRKTDKIKLRDESLLNDIPEDVQIIRTKAWDFTEWPSVFEIPGKVIARKILVPDAERVWAERSLKKAISVVESEDIRLIYTTSYPYSDHLLGLKIKKKMPHIKWVADFRDEWTNNPYTLDNPYNRFRTKKEKKMEHDVLVNADCLITNTPVMRQNFIDIHGLDGDNFFFIPNGYDIEDFISFDEDKRKENKVFTITYAGALYGRRKPDTFFKALGELIHERKIDPSKIDIRLIGNYVQTKVDNAIYKYGVREAVRILPYMPHKECVNELLKSDALLLIEGSGRGADAFYTGKIFEYMNTKRPVIAVLPRGVAADLVNETKIGSVCDYDSVEEIKAVILDFYNRFFDKTLEFSPDWDEIKKYERKVLTKRLAEVFDIALESNN